MLETINLILPIISAVLGIIVTTLGFIIPLIKSDKAKKIANSTLKIVEVLKTGISEAEKFVNYSGEEKKNYVLTIANQYAIEHKLNFDKEDVSKKIDELVALTKQVNQREKDIQAENERKLREQQEKEQQALNNTSANN